LEDVKDTKIYKVKRLIRIEYDRRTTLRKEEMFKRN
jgi:hypothetical protein